MPTLLTAHNPIHTNPDHLSRPDPAFTLDIMKRKDLLSHIHRPPPLRRRPCNRLERPPRPIRRVQRLKPRGYQEHELRAVLVGYLPFSSSRGVAAREAHPAVVGRRHGDVEDLLEGIGFAGVCACAERCRDGLDGCERVWFVAFFRDGSECILVSRAVRFKDKQISMETFEISHSCRLGMYAFTHCQSEV